MNLIQILAIVFLGVMIYGLALKLQKREVSGPFFILWMVFWLIIGVMVVFPVLLNRLADFVGVTRGVDVAIYSSILILFYSTFRIMIRLEKIDRHNADVVRRLALDKAKPPEKND